MNVIDYAVSMLDGPDLTEHRHRELVLVRLMGRVIDVILNTSGPDSDVRIETAKDLVRELKFVYPETRLGRFKETPACVAELTIWVSAAACPSA